MSGDTEILENFYESVVDVPEWYLFYLHVTNGQLHFDK
jgi:hypothetical protein